MKIVGKSIYLKITVLNILTLRLMFKYRYTDIPGTLEYNKYDTKIASKKSSPYYTCINTPKHVTSGRVHLRGLALGYTAPKERRSGGSHW